MKVQWPTDQTLALAGMSPDDPSPSQDAAMRTCFEQRRLSTDAQDPSLWHVEGRDGDMYDVHVLYTPASDPSVTCTCGHGRHNGGQARCWHSLLVLRVLRAAARQAMGRGVI